MRADTLCMQNPQQLNMAAIDTAVAEGRQVTVQFDTLGEPAPLLAELDAAAQRHGTALTVRIYGYESRVFDAAIVRALPHVASLALDFHRRAVNLEALGELTHLKQLSLGAYELAQHDILALENLRQLEVLSLGEAAHDKLDLAPLRHYASLTSLVIDGHSRHLDTLALLPALQTLSLFRIKNKVALDFLGSVAQLRELRLQLGGRNSIAAIEAPLLHKLELIRVRGLAQLGQLQRFPLLRELWVEDQIQLDQLDLSGNNALETLHLLNCKSLARLTSLAALPALQRLSISETALAPDALLAQPLPPSLHTLRFRTGKARRDTEISTQLAALGL